MCQAKSRISCTRTRLLTLMVGITMGCICCAALIIWIVVLGLPESWIADSVSDSETTAQTFLAAPTVWDDAIRVRQNLYVGVLTMKKYVATRATACNQTWGSSRGIDKIEYFTEEVPGSENDHQLPIVNVQAADDENQPDPYHNRKSFRMLQYVCEHHVDNFDWFFRAVDDIYLRVDQLHKFLATIDKNEEVYAGHATFPVDDLSYRTLEGSMYCMGGAGLIFSQPLLKGLCPFLSACENKFHHAPADVELTRCVREYMGIECLDSPQNRQYFFHSHEYNKLSSMEEFVTHQAALSLHPVKSTWLMKALHQQHLKTLVNTQLRKLHSMTQYHHSLDSFLQTQEQHTARSSQILESSPLDDESITFFTPGNVTHSAKACSPVSAMTGGQRKELDEAVRRANFSCRLGDSLVCPRMLGSYIQRGSSHSVFQVDMVCHNTTGQHVISKVTLTKRLSNPQVKKLRKRPMPADLVLLVTSKYGDPELLDFLLMVKSLANDVRQKLKVFLVLLREKSTSKSSKSSRTQREAIYTAKELKNWYNRGKFSKLVTHVADHDKDLQNSFSSVVKLIQANNSDAVVLVTSPNVEFDQNFLGRCKTITRAGSHMYQPLPRWHLLQNQKLTVGQGREGSDVTFDVMWTENSRPVCIHISDLHNYGSLNKKQLKNGNSFQKKLKVTKSLDIGLHINVL